VVQPAKALHSALGQKRHPRRRRPLPARL